MKKTSFAFYSFALALFGAGFITESSAQIRIRMPRPTIPKVVAPQQTEPITSEPSVEEKNTATAQANTSAIEYDSLMNLRFYEQSGGFLIENLEVVFPSAGVRGGTFEITRPAGEVVASVPLRYEPLERFPAFGVLRPVIGNPGTVRIAQSGDFVMAIKLGAETVTKLPFSIKEQVSSDPFNPGRSFVRSGPWSDLAYFSQITGDPTAMLHFNFWMSTRELPAGMSRPKVTLHLLANGKEIAASRGPVVPDTLDWYFYERKELIVESTPKQRWLALSDLTKQDGEIAIIVKANGQPIKAYKTQVKGGQVQTLERSRLNIEPRTDFISPRFVDLSDRSQSDFKMRDMYWLQKTP